MPDDDIPYAESDGRRGIRGKMPVGRDSRAKAASRTTWRSRQATKRISRTVSGIRNRRNKKIL